MPDETHEERRRELAAMLDQLNAILAKMCARAQTPQDMPQSMDKMHRSMDMSKSILPPGMPSRQSSPQSDTPKLAVIYARVSTTDQADKGYCLPTQLEACPALAQQPPTRQYWSRGITGKTGSTGHEALGFSPV